MHIIPERGDLPDAHYILRRVGMTTSNGMGVGPIAAGPIVEFLAATGRSASPYEIDAALLASGAYFDEHQRSDGKSTDAPWDWPKSQRDLEVFGKAQERVIRALMGE
jgi:hypothetical protein